MSGETKINTLTDEEVSEAAGGRKFEKCPKGEYEAAFPEETCRNCSYLTFHGFQFDTGRSKFEWIKCGYFNQTDRNRTDLWGIVDANGGLHSKYN